MHRRPVRFVRDCVLEWKLISVYGVIVLSMVRVMGWLSLVILEICVSLFWNQLKFLVKIAHILRQKHLAHFVNKNAQ